MSLEHSPARGDDVIVRPKQVCALLGRSRTQLWRDVRAGRLDVPIELGPNAIGWPLSVILAARERLPKRTYGAAATGAEGAA